MGLWILADAHGGVDEGADAALLDLIDRADAVGVDLLVLGDLFVAWLAHERYLTDLQREVVGRLVRTRARGRKIRFVVGNRDYLVREGLLGKAFDEVLDEETLIDLGGRPTLVAHGDRLNLEDWPYRLWFGLSRSKFASNLLLHLPRGAGDALARGVERSFSSVNMRYKRGDLPISPIEALGRRAQKLGASRALVGHYHRDATMEVAGGVPVQIAPAWLEHRRILVMGHDGELVSTPLDAL